MFDNLKTVAWSNKHEAFKYLWQIVYGWLLENQAILEGKVLQGLI